MKKWFMVWLSVFAWTWSAEASIKFNAAVLEFDASEGVSPAAVKAVSEALREGLQKSGRYTILDQKNVKAILEEQGFQKSGCTTAECQVEIGRLLNVQKMIPGSITKAGSRYVITVNDIDVETRQSGKPDSVECDSEELLRDATLALAKHFTDSVEVYGKALSVEKDGKRGDTVVVGIGSDDNVEEKNVFVVKRIEQRVTEVNPLTKKEEVKFIKYRTIGKVELSEVQASASSAKVIELKDDNFPVSKDDLVLIPAIKQDKLKPFLAGKVARQGQSDPEEDLTPAKKKRARVEAVEDGGKDNSTGRIFVGGFNGGGFMKSGVEDASGNVVTPRTSSGLMLTQHAGFGFEFGWSEGSGLDFSIPLVFELTELATPAGAKVTDISWFLMGVGLQARLYPFSFNGGERGFLRPAILLGYMGYGGTYDPDTKDSLVGPAFLLGHGALLGVGAELGPLFLEVIYRPFASAEGSFKDRRTTVNGSPNPTYNKFLIREFDLSGSGIRLGLRW